MSAQPRSRSLLSGAAGDRALIVVLALAGLWSAVAWAVAVP